ncbi:hypothetical protein SUGI_1160560 [Cryptomeria japonica]|uniref:polyadenylate-binding protein-interacting protein 12 n=1 Tax=Cryptomeria japonica TaxID=3369 RepID=UPI002414CC2B|nr:polyadenylate-binding protein-interacting protein 12 [Cryptomeria japonica]GLJ54159.1 hypothetical protein SUGI_1160560 [Cryptomeria japonica]
MANEAAVEIGLNVASASRNFGLEMEDNAQVLQLNGRFNEQVQQLQQSIQYSQQVPLQNRLNMAQNEKHMLRNQQNAMQNLHAEELQQNHLSFDHNSQIQRNILQNQQSSEANRIQHNAHVLLQQNHNEAVQGAHIVQISSPSSSSSSVQQRLSSGGPHENGRENMEACSQDFHRDMRDLEDLLSKLNPMAKEFVPPSLASHASAFSVANALMYDNHNTNFINGTTSAFIINNNNTRRRKNNYHGKNRMNSRTSIAQREDSIRRTVYVSDIDQQVTEEQLAALFINCGQVVDCRVCGDPNSVLRFAFVEFTCEEDARAALSLAGTMLGYYPVRVLPSKTAIAPVNPTFLPRSEDEREMCARTIYCTNIDKKVSQADVKLFFESLCGEVSRLRLLGDYHHSTRIAFVEFIMAESAIAALNCSGAILGSLPIRVSPSKTPVRPRTSRSPMH